MTTTYLYGADGLRTQKKVGSTVYDYYYADGLLIRQTWGSNYMDFLYDESGSAYSFIYNGTQYYYLKNLQGDVVRILNTSGTTVVAYSYDAWGKCTITSGASNAIANANPIRYRGYYYDTETGFYYLQSRYYDPAIKRFISADKALSGVGGEILGYNQYAYCFNNPVNLTDETGSWPEWTKKALIVGAVVCTIAAATALTIATCGAGSTAGVAMITGSITIASKALEVSVLQKRKSESEEKSDLDIAGDVVESLWDNAESIIGATPVFKAGGY